MNSIMYCIIYYVSSIIYYVYSIMISIITRQSIMNKLLVFK